MSETFFFPKEQRGQVLRLVNLFTNHPGDEIQWQIHEGEKGLTITVERVPTSAHPARPGNPADWREQGRNGWAEHRRFPITEWSRQASRLETRLGYLEWVAYRLEEEENEGPGVWQRGAFTIDGVFGVVGYRLIENIWNGWEVPGFPKDNLLHWLKQMSPDDQRIVYDPEKDAVFCPGDEFYGPEDQWAVGFDVMTEDGPMHLYAPDGWRFSITNDPDAPCDNCGHTKEVHIYGGEGQCGFCDCPKFIPFTHS